MTFIPSDKPWPPPPDLNSVKELVAGADVEGFIGEGAPADEYEMEAEEIFTAICEYETTELTVERLVPVLEEIWAGAFELDEAALVERRPKLNELAVQVARFFGPEARPLVRGA